jgi:hypothetical protein
MDLAYVIDHENRVIHYNPVYKHVIPTFDYDKYEMPVPISETRKRGLAPEVLLEVLNIDYSKLNDKEWAGTHPNGILLNSCPPIKALASMGFIYRSYGVTAWHNVMSMACGKGVDIINVPTISYYDNRSWRVNIFTRPVVLTNHVLGKYYFETEYDTAIVETNYNYPYKYTSVKGEVVCAYGVLSAITSEFTLASYLPSVVDTPYRCPPLKLGDEVEVLSWVSGHRKAKVISTDVVSGYVLNKIYFLEFSKLFKLDISSIPGDSGGAVYTKVPPGVII